MMIFFLKKFKVVGHRRDDGCGGAGILIKNNIFYVSIDLPKFDVINAVAIRTTNLDQHFSFVSVYVPSKKQEISEATVRQDLIKLLNVVNALKYCIIGGDFNSFHAS